MPESPTFRTTLQVIEGSPGLAPLITRLSESYVSWDEFMTLPTPGGLTARESWELLTAIFRAQGTAMPFGPGGVAYASSTAPSEDGFDTHSAPNYWYHNTLETNSIGATLFGHCMRESGLFSRLTDARNAEITVRLQVDEIVASAALDGVTLPARSAHSVPHLQRPPRGASDRLVYNVLSTIRDLPAYVGTPITPELILHLHDRLLDKVELEKLSLGSARSGLTKLAIPVTGADTPSPAEASRRIGVLSSYLNWALESPAADPLVIALLIPEMFRSLLPLRNMNNQVGRVLLRLFAINAEMPVLGMLPLSQTKVHWLEGYYTEGPLAHPPSHFVAAHADDKREITGTVTLAIRIAEEALEDLSEALRRQAERDEDLRSLVQRDPELNHRQRSILGRALRDPEAEFLIAYHRQTHNVVYATARADLLGLVDRGYLKMNERGRTFVFTPRPNLHEYIEATYASEQPQR